KYFGLKSPRLKSRTGVPAARSSRTCCAVLRIPERCIPLASADSDAPSLVWSPKSGFAAGLLATRNSTGQVERIPESPSSLAHALRAPYFRILDAGMAIPSRLGSL